MAFDKTKPVFDTDAESQEIRDNFNALATQHIGATAPSDPDVGWVWLDTSNASNWIQKCYSQDGANPPAWVATFEHMESTPTPAAGGGGGAFTRGTVTGSFQQSAQNVKQRVDITGFQASDFLITRCIMWPTPVGGGQFPAEYGFGMRYSFVPRDAGTPAGLDAMMYSRASIFPTVAQFDNAAPQGQNFVVANGGAVYGILGPIGLYDGTNVEFHNVWNASGNTLNIDGTVQKVGGYTTADFVIPVLMLLSQADATNGVYSDLDDSGEIHLLMFNMRTQVAVLNYRVDYLYLA